MKKYCRKCGTWLAETWKGELCSSCEKDILISKLKKDVKKLKEELLNANAEIEKFQTMDLVDLSFQNKNVAELIERGAELEKRFIAATDEILKLKKQLGKAVCLLKRRQLETLAGIDQTELHNDIAEWLKGVS